MGPSALSAGGEGENALLKFNRCDVQLFCYRVCDITINEMALGVPLISLQATKPALMTM